MVEGFVGDKILPTEPNPYDPCFYRKRPCFGGLTFKIGGSFGLSAVFEGLFHKRI